MLVKEWKGIIAISCVHRTFYLAFFSKVFIIKLNPNMLISPEAESKKKTIVGKQSGEFNSCSQESEYPERQ